MGDFKSKKFQLGMPPDEMQALQAQYANRYVAICGGEVIAAGVEITEVMTQAENLTKGKKCFIKFIPPEDLLVLNLSNST